MSGKTLGKTLCLIAGALLAMGAAPKKPAPPKAPATDAARPAAAAPAKPAAPPVMSPVPNFDERNPASVAALMNTGGAKAVQVQKDADSVLLNVTSVAANFTLQFIGCDAQGRACKALQFDLPDDKPGPTFAQVNAFNQTSATCRVFEDRAGKPHLIYSMLLFADDPYQHFVVQAQAWTGCIAEFRGFLKDPNGYLASAP